jgi:hypothetical protein
VEMLFVKKHNKGDDCKNAVEDEENMCLYWWCSSPSVVLLQVKLWRKRRR